MSRPELSHSNDPANQAADGPAASQRKIIHCDCDCFYASIEMRDDPDLQGKPVAVGGASERRGVIATCNYEARKSGVHSAMPTATALRLCPDLILIPPAMDKYRQASQQMHEIFRRYTWLIEPLSLDEAYLDVSQATVCQGSATLIAEAIRNDVRRELGITLSAGIAPNKFIAKIASDWNKPDGQFVVTPDRVDDFVRALPVKKLFGVGKVTAARMQELGINLCADLRTRELDFLLQHFGSFGHTLYRLCRGIDEREVKTDRIRKSLSVENTYAQDLPTLDSCLQQLPDLHRQMQERLQRVLHKYQVNKKYVKIKFHDFVSTTAEHVAEDSGLYGYQVLMREAWHRGERPVRLLGIGVRLNPLESADGSKDTRQIEQLALPW
ncbi:MAG: DNA polymerase IV [Pseudomonadales bacterium]|nr:DNA polymerase IV [Pseudomonadales bacterium]